MFEKFDLAQALDKDTYENIIPGLRDRIGVLQREFRDQQIPVIIVFEGWRFSGISGTINRLTYALDPRGCRVHPTQQPSEIERAHPMLWRFWVNTPSKGKIAIFDRSWYTDTMIACAESDRKTRFSPETFSDILNMEEELADDGAVIIKFFLHISKKEQKKRQKKFQKLHPEFSPDDSRAPKRLRNYDNALPKLETLITETDTARTPWMVVEATDRHFTIIKVYETIISRMEEILKHKSLAATKSTKKKTPAAQSSILHTTDLTKSLPEEDYIKRLGECEERLHNLQYTLNRKKIPVTILFEGWDAAGKGGAIIRLDRALNPRCSVVEPIAAPTWYGRVLVERVEGFCTDADWQRAYHEINVLEDYLVRSGTIFVKFWLQIDQETQLERFKEREEDPLKKYKITEEDYRNREKWALYDTAIDEMLEKTSTPIAPWTIVEANDKYYSRIKIMEKVIERIETGIYKNKKKVKKCDIGTACEM
ncbi:MAG: phosphate--AMP phosphotransferase [Methanoregula sp.]|nr:phosphate--AMP phosphotransferase [Methanoregula sp.]